MRHLLGFVFLFCILGLTWSDAYCQSSTGIRVECIGDGIRDTDGDGLCDNLDLDDDNDGCADIIDDDQFRVGTDTDNDGFANACDDDDDNDGVRDADDPQSLNPMICGDTDSDGCDDCSRGVDQFGVLYDIDPLNDGPDPDGDGICNLSDCGPPENLALIDSDWFSATLGWDEIPAAHLYKVEIRFTFLPYVIKRGTVRTNEYTTRLFPFLPYEFRVKAHCGSGFTEWSYWHPFSFYPFANAIVQPVAEDFSPVEENSSITERSFTAYPNPTSGLVNILYSGPSLTGAEIRITDLSGRNVFYDVMDWVPSEEKTLDLSGFANGMYLINLVKDDVILTTEKIFLSK